MASNADQGRIPRAESRPGANAYEFSVSELSGAIKRALEDGFGYVRLRGEISGYRGPHASGHCYFTLKDEKAKIEAVIWKGTFSRLRFKPAEGLEVIAQGKVTTFPGSSKYQIVIENLEPAGAGALMALLEERKRRLQAEGLFEEARKRPRPFLPRLIGIITSPTGAVIRDMLHGFDERFPSHVVVWPVRVQGEGSPQEVAAAIRGFNALLPGGPIPRPDLLIVARGGGALEDLWGFNEEIVVRAAAESTIPIISAVGHETDWTLLDLVADARAPTPTKAAEWAVPKYGDLAEAVSSLSHRQRSAVRRYLDETRNELRAEARGLPRLQDLIAMPRQRFDHASARLTGGIGAYLQRRKTRFAEVGSRLPHPRGLVRLARHQLDAAAPRLQRALLGNTRALAQRLVRVESRLSAGQITKSLANSRKDLLGLERRAAQALSTAIAMRRRRLDGEANMMRTLSYQSVLARGFALVRTAGGRAVRLAAQLSPGDVLSIEFSDARRAAEVLPASGSEPPPRQPTLREGAKDAAKVRSPKDDAAKPGGSREGPGGQGSLF